MLFKNSLRDSLALIWSVGPLSTGQSSKDWVKVIDYDDDDDDDDDDDS